MSQSLHFIDRAKVALPQLFHLVINAHILDKKEIDFKIVVSVPNIQNNCLIVLCFLNFLDSERAGKREFLPFFFCFCKYRKRGNIFAIFILAITWKSTTVFLDMDWSHRKFPLLVSRQEIFVVFHSHWEFAVLRCWTWLLLLFLHINLYNIIRANWKLFCKRSPFPSQTDSFSLKFQHSQCVASWGIFGVA